MRKVSTEADNIHLPVVGRIFQRHAAREAGVKQALALQAQTAHLQLRGSHTSLKLQAYETVAVLQPGWRKAKSETVTWEEAMQARPWAVRQSMEPSAIR